MTIQEYLDNWDEAQEYTTDYYSCEDEQACIEAPCGERNA